MVMNSPELKHLDNDAYQQAMLSAITARIGFPETLRLMAKIAQESAEIVEKVASGTHSKWYTKTAQELHDWADHLQTASDGPL